MILRKSLIFLTFLLFTSVIHAQVFNIQGVVSDSSLNPVQGVLVIIKADTSNYVYNDSTFTDSTGAYSFTVSLNSFTNNYVALEMLDCNLIFEQVNFQKPIPGGSITKNFIYCGECEGEIITSLNGLTATFTASNDVNLSSYSYFWDYGDGNGFQLGLQSTNFNYFVPGIKGIQLQAIDSSDYQCSYNISDTVNVLNSTSSVTLILAGYVEDDLFFQPIPNKTIHLSLQSLFPVNLGSVTTNIAGIYDTTVVITDTSGTIKYELLDCLGNIISDSTTFSGTDSIYIQKNFTICENYCSAGFTYQIQGDTVSFFSYVNPSPSPAATYSWDFGDSTVSFDMNPTHIYNAPGWYEVCLTVYDGNCFDTYCDSVLIGNTPCNFSFNTQVYGQNVIFSAINYTGESVTSYSWDFGDGNFSTGQTAIHQYILGGIYNVCLNINRPALSNCTICDSISISGNTGPPSITGNISVNGNLRQGDLVILYEDLGSGTAPYIKSIDTVINYNGSYSFYNVSDGIYQIRSIPYNNSKNPGLIPKYWNNTTYWANGTSIIYNSGTLQADFNHSSTNFLLNGSSKIVINIQDSLNSPFGGAIIWLENSNGDIISFDLLSANSLEFNNLINGNYLLGIDLPGYLMNKIPVSIAGPNSTEIVNISIQNNWIVSSNKTLISEKNISVFPNPFNGYFRVSGVEENVKIELSDIHGRRIPLDITSEGLVKKVEMRENISRGIYLLKISDGQKNKLIRLISTR